jgi:hypothetical protein
VTAQTGLTAAQQAWSVLAPRLAGRGAMRVSRDGGRTYPKRYQRRITAVLPSQPAAVLLYDDNDHTSMFCLDLDSSRGDVDRDLARVTALLRRTGLTSWFTDRSPSGGRHVYIPLEERIPLAEASAAIRALAAMTPTLDPMPMLGATSGCLRPPGARHRSGGFQQLDDDLEHAISVLNRPNGPDAWRRFLAQLSVEQAPSQPLAALTSRQNGSQSLSAATEGAADPSEHLAPLRGFSEPDANFRQIAVTGDYDPQRYLSPSDARQGVVWACVASGWTFLDLVRRLEDGTWRGLASFYARYPARHRRTAVQNDWRQAVAFEKQRRDNGGIQHVRVRTTSPLKSHARGTGAPQNVNREVRQWLAAVDLLTAPGIDLSERAVLYALAEAAVLTNSLVVEHGNRHLAIAAGKTTGGHTTVGRILKQLVDAPADRALVDLVRPAAGVKANAYQLTIPPLLRASAEAKPWRRGRIHGIRPVFRELGLPAAFVYAALEQSDDPLSGRAVGDAARIGHTAAADALLVLAEWGLAERTSGGWIRGPADLNQLAEAWGLVEQIREQIAHYRRERADWVAWLTARGVIVLGQPGQRSPPPPDPDTLPPPDLDDAETALELVQRILGARAIA